MRVNSTCTADKICAHSTIFRLGETLVPGQRLCTWQNKFNWLLETDDPSVQRSVTKTCGILVDKQMEGHSRTIVPLENTSPDAHAKGFQICF